MNNTVGLADDGPCTLQRSSLYASLMLYNIIFYHVKALFRCFYELHSFVTKVRYDFFEHLIKPEVKSDTCDLATHTHTHTHAYV